MCGSFEPFHFKFVSICVECITLQIGNESNALYFCLPEEEREKRRHLSQFWKWNFFHGKTSIICLFAHVYNILYQPIFYYYRFFSIIF